MDRYSQAESHGGKLNSLLNVSNHGANPGIGISRTAHYKPLPEPLCLSYLRSKAICQSPQLLACLLKMIHLEQHWCIVILLLVFYEWIHRPLEQI